MDSSLKFIHIGNRFRSGIGVTMVIQTHGFFLSTFHTYVLIRVEKKESKLIIIQELLSFIPKLVKMYMTE